MAVSGPLARTIADVRLAFHAMAAGDGRDPWWTPVPLDLGPAPKRAALTVAPDGLKVVPEVEKALRDAARRLEAAGWEVIERDCPPFRKPVELQLALWLAEFRRTAAQAVKDEADPDATFVYEQMAALCPEPSLDGMLDILQARVTLGARVGAVPRAASGADLSGVGRAAVPRSAGRGSRPQASAACSRRS